MLEGAKKPGAIAIDTATGQVLWTESEPGGAGAIRAASLIAGAAQTPHTLYTEPSGSEPTGIAVNASNGKLYWTDAGSARIMSGSIDGSAAAPASVLFEEPAGSKPSGLAIDSAANELYWTDEGEAGKPGTIRSGSLNGGAATMLFTEADGALPDGIAIDSGAATLYWIDSGSGEIRSGSQYGTPGGTGEGKQLYAEGASAKPRGIAIDLRSGELYWADAGTGTIQYAPIGGSPGVPQSLFTLESAPAFPTLLLTPSGTGAPKVSGREEVGNTLSCGRGSWSANTPGANLYAAPSSYSYQWESGGVAILGATAAAYSPTSEGSYTCAVTAANAAGSSAQVSAAVAVKAKPPIAAISYPVNGAIFEQDAVVSTSFSCTEGAGGPGLSSCKDGKGTSSPAGRLDTSRLGLHQYFVTAISKDGRRSRATVTVTIVQRKPAPPKPPAPPKAPKPTPPPRPFVTIVTAKAGVFGRRAKIVLACHRAACSGTLSLTVRVSGRALARADHRRPPSRGAKALSRSIQLLFVKMSYSLVSGARKPIVLMIRPQARKLLLSARQHRLTVRAALTVKGGVPKHRGIVLRLQGGRRR